MLWVGSSRFVVVCLHFYSNFFREILAIVPVDRNRHRVWDDFSLETLSYCSDLVTNMAMQLSEHQFIMVSKQARIEM